MKPSDLYAKRIRLEKTKQEMAELIGLNPDDYERYESGEKAIPGPLAFAISKKTQEFEEHVLACTSYHSPR